MEKVLRSASLDTVKELYKAAFTHPQLRLFPIRHHSPVCSYHLKKVIQEFQPDCILIEGPSNANELIPYLTHEESQPPFAIYYSFRNKSIDKEYKCYYPFLSCSPEYTAMIEGKHLGCEIEFMDLSYDEIILNCEEEKRLLNEPEKSSYNDDYLVAGSDYIKYACEKTGMRSFDEFWEKYFEMDGWKLPSSIFIQNLLTDCYLARITTSEEMMWKDGCLIREQFMAQYIQEKMCQNKKVLAVIGGFHTQGILYHLGLWQESIRTIPWKSHKTPKEDTGVYIMSYSEDAADMLNGYRSGMPFPAFYRRVYEGMEKGCERPFEEVVQDILIECGKLVRRKEGGVSTYDEICAMQMCQGLAALRGKKEAGAYELIDSVQSSFIKGELNHISQMPLIELRKVMSGRKRGVLASIAPVPPIVQDFEKLCKKYRLHVSGAARRELILEPFSKERHLLISFFLRRMNYLGTEFSHMKKGPQLAMGRNLNLIRETWEYRYRPEVIHRLIDQSVYGGTIAEASENLLLISLQESLHCGDASVLVLHAMEMGFTESMSKILSVIESMVVQESSFIELAGSLKHLLFASQRKGFYKVENADVIIRLIRIIYEKMVLLLETLENIEDERITVAVGALKNMYQAVLNQQYELDGTLLQEGLKFLVMKKTIKPLIRGRAYGILYGFCSEYKKDIIRAGWGYVRGSGDSKTMAAPFFRGLFNTAKDMVMEGTEFLAMINELLYEISEDDFVEILPELRMAFAYFMPQETDEIAKKVARLFGRNEKELKRYEISGRIYTLGECLDQEVQQFMKEEEIGWKVTESAAEMPGIDGAWS